MLNPWFEFGCEITKCPCWSHVSRGFGNSFNRGMTPGARWQNDQVIRVIRISDMALCVTVHTHKSRSPEESLWKIGTAGKLRHWLLDMETTVGDIPAFCLPPSNKHWWILSALSVYGSTMLSMNCRLVHLLAVLIPLTNLVPAFWFARSVLWC